MEIFIARQPIFKTNKQLFGYELLFRDSMRNVFPGIDGDTATSTLFSHTFSTLDMERISGGRLMFINFPTDLLVREVPKLFPQDQLMVEILEDVPPDKEVISACENISKAGYPIALDDFLFRYELLPLVRIADIIKFDFRLTPLESIKKVIEQLAGHRLRFLAEKIETHEEFEAARDLGFSYFQGYFFCKPEIISGKDIPPNKVMLLQIMAETNNENFNVSRLSDLVNKDVSMTYKLLRYINSAYFSRPQRIRSVQHAMTMLGETEVKKFFSVVAAADIASDKPNELLRSSIVRARMCELIGKYPQLRLDPFEAFLTGMFSRIDAMLDNTVENIVNRLPLSGSVKDALISGKGLLAEVLRFVSFFESGQWSRFFDAAADLDIDTRGIPGIYMDSVCWADTYSENSEKDCKPGSQL